MWRVGLKCKEKPSRPFQKMWYLFLIDISVGSQKHAVGISKWCLITAYLLLDIQIHCHFSIMCLFSRPSLPSSTSLNENTLGTSTSAVQCRSLILYCGTMLKFNQSWNNLQNSFLSGVVWGQCMLRHLERIFYIHISNFDNCFSELLLGLTL